MSKTKIRKSVTRVGSAPWNHVFPREGYRSGVVYCKHGLVDVHTEPDLTVLRAMHEDRIYQENHDREYTPRYLVTLAVRFAARVAVESSGDEVMTSQLPPQPEPNP